MWISKKKLEQMVKEEVDNKSRWLEKALNSEQEKLKVEFNAAAVKLTKEFERIAAKQDGAIDRLIEDGEYNKKHRDEFTASSLRHAAQVEKFLASIEMLVTKMQPAKKKLLG